MNNPPTPKKKEKKKNESVRKSPKLVHVFVY